MIDLKLVFFDPSGDVAVAINFCLLLSAELIFVTLVASGAAGWANVGWLTLHL